MRFQRRTAWSPWAIVLVFFLAGCGDSRGPAPLDEGRALLGPLAGATAQIFAVADDGSFDLLFTETTTDTGELETSGLFDTHAASLEPGRLYLFKVTGGRDLDVDDNGVLDPFPTPNNGALHGVFTGAQVRSGLLHVTILSELVYQRVRYMLGAGYPRERILAAIDGYTRNLLAGEVDGDDLLAWDPVSDRGLLRRDWAEFGAAAESLRSNDVKDLHDHAMHLTDNSLALIRTSNGARSVFVDGTIAYVAISDGGVAVVDVTNPARPNLLTVVPTNDATRDLVVIGSHLYVAAREDFYTFDVSDPANPVLRGTMEMDDARRMTSNGNFVYVAEEDSGVTVIDVSAVPGDPPLKRSQIDTPDSARDVFFANGYVYVADEEELVVIDPSDPDNPVIVDSFDTIGDRAEGIAVVGTLAYVGYRDEDGLEIVDVSDPNNMFRVGNLDGRDGCEDVAVAGNFAYAAADDSGLMVANVANPASPALVGHARLTDTDTRNVAVANGYAYLATNAGLAIIDLASLNAGEFVEAEDFLVLGNLDTVGDVEDVTASGNTAFVASGWDGMYAIDFSDPVNPVTIDYVDTPDDAERITIDGSLVYIADSSHIQVIDVTDPHNCVSRAPLETNDETNDVVVRDGYAYVADRYGQIITHNQFLIFDVSDPDNPIGLGDLGLGGDSARGVAVGSNPNYVFVAWGFAGLRVVDVSDKGDPFFAAGMQLPDPGDPDWCARIVVNGNYAYVMGDDTHIVDITNPENPQYVRTLSGANDIVFSGTYAYVAVGSEGVYVYDATDPTDPVLIEVMPTAHDAQGVAISNGMLLVADEEGGFSVLKSLGTKTVP